MRRGLRFLIWAVSIYLVLCSAIAFFLADVTVHPYRRPSTTETKANVQNVAAGSDAQLTDVAIEPQSHVTLRAWLIQPQHGNGNAVILLHGLGDNRLGMTGYAQLLLAHGYTVLMPDARAHGESGGDIATYGIIERDDIRRWFEWLDQAAHPSCIYGLGESMGAAQLLQSLSTEPHFCAVVAESSFSNFREIAYDRMGQRFGTGPWIGRTVLRPVAEIALLVARVKYQVDLTRASPEDAVAQTHVPVLIIHGVVDSNIPLRHSLRLVAHNRQLQLWQVPGADHCGAISVARQEFEKRVVEWFELHKGTGGKSPRDRSASKFLGSYGSLWPIADRCSAFPVLDMWIMRPAQRNVWGGHSCPPFFASQARSSRGISFRRPAESLAPFSHRKVAPEPLSQLTLSRPARSFTIT